MPNAHQREIAAESDLSLSKEIHGPLFDKEPEVAIHPPVKNIHTAREDNRKNFTQHRVEDDQSQVR